MMLHFVRAIHWDQCIWGQVWQLEFLSMKDMTYFGETLAKSWTLPGGIAQQGVLGNSEDS